MKYLGCNEEFIVETGNNSRHRFTVHQQIGDSKTIGLSGYSEIKHLFRLSNSDQNCPYLVRLKCTELYIVGHYIVQLYCSW